MSGDRVNWSAPLAMHPVNPNILYFGTYRVWKTTNKGNSWLAVSGDLTKGIDQYFHTITTLAISPLDPSIVVAGSGDGRVHISTNDGSTWTDISAGLPDRWVTRVAVDYVDQQTIYATLSGFRWDEPLPHIFKSTNLGQTWEDISGNLPEFPVNDLVLDPDISGKIFVATDAGMYGTIDGGDTWQWIWTDIPAVPIYALKVHVLTRTLVAGTYGLSTYSANLDDLLTGTGPIHSQTTLNLTIAPNPVTPNTHVRFNLPGADQFTIVVSDMTGKVVRASAPGVLILTEGPQTLLLTSLIHGFPLSEGLYLITIQSQTYRMTGKIIVTG